MHDDCICDWEDAKLNYLTAKHYLNLSDTKNALEHIKLAVNAAKAFDFRPEEQRSSSLFMGEKTINRKDFDTADSRSLFEILCNEWLKDKAFDFIRKNDEFIKIINA